MSWIKMRMDLQTHPKVLRMASAICPQNVRNLSANCPEKFAVIGGLHAVWSLFDQHSEDGILVGYTLETMDRIIGWSGFAAAMEAVGWLRLVGETGLEMPGFQSHNGKSAKRRAEDNRRKKDSRNSPQNVREMSAADADKKRTREEKIRNNTPPTPSQDSSFLKFWELYPRRAARKLAVKAWAKIKPSEVPAILADVERRKVAEWSRTETQFIPLPASYLNGRRWEDEPSSSDPGRPRHGVFVP